jgi:hypothetical protein
MNQTFLGMHEPIPLAMSPLNDFAFASGKDILAGNPDPSAFRSQRYETGDNKSLYASQLKCSFPFFVLITERNIKVLFDCLVDRLKSLRFAGRSISPL